MASMTRRSPWPMLTDMSWLLKSRMPPSGVWPDPSARSMAMGSMAPCTDHEKNVCSRLRATISSAVSAPGTVPMPMGPLLARRRPVDPRLARHARRALAPITAHPLPGRTRHGLVRAVRGPSARLAGRTPPASQADAGRRRSRSAVPAPQRSNVADVAAGWRRPARRHARAATRRHAARRARIVLRRPGGRAGRRSDRAVGGRRPGQDG